MVRPWHSVKRMVRTIAYDKTNTILMIIAFLIPLSCFLVFMNQYDGYTIRGFDAIESRYQWFQQYQGELDQSQFEMILDKTMVNIDDYHYVLTDLISDIQLAKRQGSYLGISGRDVLLNIIRFDVSSNTTALIERFMDEDLMIILPKGLTIDDSEGVMALIGDHLSIFILLCALCLLIIARSIDHLHMDRNIALERSYANGYKHHIQLMAYHFFYGLIMMAYGWIILLSIYNHVYHGLGLNNSFALYSGTLQASFASISMGQFLIFVVIHDALLFMIAIDLTILMSMKCNGLFSWIISCMIMLIVFLIQDSLVYNANFYSMVLLALSVTLDYTYFPLSYGSIIVINGIEGVVILTIILFMIKRGYQRIA